MTRGSAEAVGSRRGRVGEGWLGPTEASPVASSARQKYRSYLPEPLQCRTLLPCAISGCEQSQQGSAAFRSQEKAKSSRDCVSPRSIAAEDQCLVMAGLSPKL